MSITTCVSNYTFIKTLNIIEKNAIAIISKELYAVSRKTNDKCYNIDYCMKFFLKSINTELKTVEFTNNKDCSHYIQIDYLIYNLSYIYVLYIVTPQVQMLYDLENGRAIEYYNQQVRYININQRHVSKVDLYLDKNLYLSVYLICKAFPKQYTIKTNSQKINLSSSIVTPLMQIIIKKLRLPASFQDKEVILE